MSDKSAREFDMDPLSQSNVAQAALVYVAAFNGPPWSENWSLPSSTQRLTEIMHTPGFIGVVLSDRGDRKPVALGAGAFETWYNGKNFQIKELCVDPSLHGHGLGKRVLDAVTAEAVRQGATKIYLYTARHSPAEKMYSENGFIASDEVVMELDVASTR